MCNTCRTISPIKPTKKDFDDRGNALRPLPFRFTSNTALLSTDVRCVAYVDGRLFGYADSGDELHVSDDKGATWSLYASGLAGAGFVHGIFATDDDEVVVFRSQNILKSSGWTGGSPTWSIKATSSTATVGGTPFSFREWGTDGDGTKFVCSEYGNPWQDQTDPIHTWISTDSGDTFTKVISTGSVDFPTLATHFHGACYDKWNDRFYVSFGHGNESGIWCSEDDGANWTKIADAAHRLGRGSATYSSFTTLTATPNRIILGSDDTPSCVACIETSVAPASQFVEILHQDLNGNGLSYFTIDSVYDEERDLVYVTHNAWETNGRSNGMFAVRGRQVARVWTWTETTGVQGDTPRSICVAPDGDLVWHILMANGDYWQVNAEYIEPGSSNSLGTFDATSIFGTLTDRTAISWAIGPVTFADAECLVVGYNNTAGGLRSTLIGGNLDTDENNVVAVGTNITFESGAGGEMVAVGTNISNVGFKSTIIGFASNGNNHDGCTGVGRDVTFNGVNGVGIGDQIDVATASVAIGRNANVTAQNSEAIGNNALAGHSNSTALGRGVSTTASSQVMIGNRDLEITSSAKGVVLVSPNGTRWRLTVDDTGTLQTASL